LRVFEEKVLRRIFGPKRKEVTGWRKVDNEKLHMYSSPNIRVIRLIMRWVGYVAHMGEVRSIYKIVVSKPHTTWMT